MRAELPNSEGTLLPGQFVRVRLQTGERNGVFLVPQAAVLTSDKGKVRICGRPDGKAGIKPVQAGEWQGKDWVILGGLKAGDRSLSTT